MANREGSTLPWSFRFAEATRAPLLVVGLGVAVAYLCFFVLSNNLAGSFDGLRIEDRFFWFHPFGVMVFTYSLGFGYLVIVVSHVMRFSSACLRDLSPVLTLEPSEIAEFDNGLRRIKRWQLRLMGIVGLITVSALDIWFFATVHSDSRPQPWAWWMAFSLVQDWVFTWLLFRMVAVFFTVSSRFSQLGERHVAIDLFDFRGARPLTSLGLRLALLTFIAMAITIPSIFAVTVATDVGMLLIYGFIAVGIPVSLAAILAMLPLRGVHHSIVRAKRSALERVRTEAAREQEAMFASNEERKTLATQRLPGLLAYEARVERVREWSLDFPAFLRFALYVLIPLGSWVAAAFVERALGVALE